MKVTSFVCLHKQIPVNSNGLSLESVNVQSDFIWHVCSC